MNKVLHFTPALSPGAFFFKEPTEKYKSLLKKKTLSQMSLWRRTTLPLPRGHSQTCGDAAK